MAEQIHRSFSNGNKAKILAIFYIIASTGFILVKDVTLPLLNQSTSGKNVPLSEQVALNTKRLDLIEIFDASLSAKVDTLLAGSATRAEAISNLKTVVDRIEKKLDDHMVRQ